MNRLRVNDGECGHNTGLSSNRMLPPEDLVQLSCAHSYSYTHPAMRMMTRRGSLAMVKMKRAKAGPNAMKAQPKNTAAVMLKTNFS